MGITNKERYRRKNGKATKKLNLRNSTSSDGLESKIVLYKPEPAYKVSNEPLNIRSNTHAHFEEVIKSMGESEYIREAIEERVGNLMYKTEEEKPLDLNKTMRDSSDIASNLACPNNHILIKRVQLEFNGGKSDIFSFEDPISQGNFLKVIGGYFPGVRKGSWGIDFDPQP